MMASIDGRIDCSMVDKISGDEYYTALGELDCPSTLEGRVTMEHYSALEGHYAAKDPAPAMKTLRGEFGVERLALLGGGNINGGFLAAGLIDEVSLMIGQGIDGRKGQTAVFDGIADEGWMPAKMALADVKRLDCGTVWLRYRAERP